MIIAIEMSVAAAAISIFTIVLNVRYFSRMSDYLDVLEERLDMLKEEEE